MFNWGCATVVTNRMAAAVTPIPSVKLLKLLLGDNKFNSELMLTNGVLLLLFHSAAEKKHAGDSTASKIPSLSSSISITSLIPSPSVSLQAA